LETGAAFALRLGDAADAVGPAGCIRSTGADFAGASLALDDVGVAVDCEALFPQSLIDLDRRGRHDSIAFEDATLGDDLAGQIGIGRSAVALAGLPVK